jgi:hypothetical protein
MAQVHSMEEARRDQRPQPLVPAECDLSGFEYMKLKIENLTNSRSWIVAKKRDKRLGFVMMNLWMKAFRSKPAGSLENDPLQLADAAGCSEEEWEDFGKNALEGWVLCSDGRLYHRYLCYEIVLPAWADKVKWRSRGKAGADARWGGKEGEADASSKGQGSQGRGRGKGKESSASGGPASPRSMLFDTGLQAVQMLTGRSKASARSLIGELLANAGDDASHVMKWIHEAAGRAALKHAELAVPADWLIETSQRHAAENGIVRKGKGREAPKNAATRQIEDMLAQGAAVEGADLFEAAREDADGYEPVGDYIDMEAE